MERRFVRGEEPLLLAAVRVQVPVGRGGWWRTKHLNRTMVLPLLILAGALGRAGSRRAWAFRPSTSSATTRTTTAGTALSSSFRRRSAFSSSTTIESSSRTRNTLLLQRRSTVSTKNSLTAREDDKDTSDAKGVSSSGRSGGATIVNDNNSSNNNNNNIQLRQELLRDSLLALGLDAEGLERAVRQSLEDATAGYDDRYGRSAVRACRSFCHPKQRKQQTGQQQQPPPSHRDDDPVQLRAAAARTARQVEFLWKRHQSHRAEWVRHHDNESAQQPNKKRFPLALVLDNLRSAGNAGSLFRTADAAGCALVVTVGITPHPGGSGQEKLHKSALGAEQVVPTQHFATLAAAVEYLRQPPPGGGGGGGNNRGYTVIGMETTEHSRAYTEWEYDAERGVALVLGNEVTGVDAAILPQLDGIVEIPMFGSKNSLNVAACAPIVLYEIIRQWNGSTSSPQPSGDKRT